MQSKLLSADTDKLWQTWKCAIVLGNCGNMEGAERLSEYILETWSPPDFKITACFACGHSIPEEHFPWCALRPDYVKALEIDELARLWGPD